MTQNHENSDGDIPNNTNDPSPSSPSPEATSDTPTAAANLADGLDSPPSPPCVSVPGTTCACGCIPYFHDDADKTGKVKPETPMTDTPSAQPPGQTAPFRMSSGVEIPPLHNPHDYAQRRDKDREPGAVFRFADGTSMQSSIPERGRRTDIGRKAEAWNVDREINHLATDMENTLPHYGPASIARVQRLTVALLQSCLDEDRWGNCPEGSLLVAELGLVVQAIGHILFVGEDDEEEDYRR